MSSVEARALVRRFGRQTAVGGIDLDVDTNGVVGLLGPNGSGKTTLLRMIATVLPPSSGDLRVLGLDPDRAGDRTAIRRRLGYLPQDPGLYPGFTAFDLVDYVAVLKEMTGRAARHDEVRRVLEEVDLTAVMHKKIRSLSGGMRQRVALAAALLGTPDLLVLDEPASGLDPDQRLRLRSILSSHGRRSTVLLSTHHTAEVAAFCQRVVVVLDGTVRFDGTPSKLAAVAEGRVWRSPDVTEAAGVPAGRAAPRSWVAADGTTRSIGTPPTGADLLEPTLDDGYLLLARDGA